MNNVIQMDKRIKAIVVDKNGNKRREYDITSWPIEKYNVLRQELELMGFDVRIKRVHSAAA